MHRHCEQREAIQDASSINGLWIATSLRSSRWRIAQCLL